MALNSYHIYMEVDDMAIEVNKSKILIPMICFGIVAVLTLFVVLLRKKARKEK